MDSKKAHDLLEHCNQKATRETAVELGWVITGENHNPCLDCTAAKAKQKILSRSGKDKARESNARVEIDTSVVKPSKIPGIIVSKPNWLMVVD